MPLPQEVSDQVANLLQSTPTETSITAVIFALVLSTLFCYLLAKLYEKYGTALSNRKQFASNFILIGPTIALIILVVKSSLALSLGLVGALSVVRFRTAIKEPEELAFLLVVIGIGLGLGAYQWLITLVSFIIIACVIIFRHSRKKKYEHHNLYLTLAGPSKNITLSSILNILVKHCKAVRLKRFDKTKDTFEASFLVDLPTYHHFSHLKSELEKLSDALNITYLDREGIS